ncbi:MAG: hypothetical protein KDA95_07375 [Acidimicrobiales bacterium]|nr:hypothetical protein [Acidimicrobiales bacterium]
MHNELDSVTNGDANFEQMTAGISANQHYQAIEIEDSDRVSISVQHGVFMDPVLSSAHNNDRIHTVRLP